MLSTLAVLGVLASSGCNETTPDQTKTPEASATPASVSRTPEPESADEPKGAVKTPYRPPSKELRGKDPFTK